MTISKEWQIGSTLADDGTRREYIVHLVSPRFTARVVRVDPFDELPIETEGEADVVNGFVYQIDRRTVLCEIEWDDKTPNADERDFAALWLGEADRAWDRLRGQFLRWKALPPVQDMTGRIDLDISGCRSWSDYTEAFCRENDRADGELVKRVRHLAAVVSTGEVPVLIGMLHAADYSRVADEIGGDDIWRRLSRTCGEHAEAAALAIMRQ
ncbi:hypothetical protein [Ensifer adhaerens]|uniref:hypothetical protein n=1 Tax=Ensifer adhaerens TaxID=106592 RepID=UPI001C4DEBB9|nr:hypothetical protein [Ensifer adhaerens]MBW0366130.1 hypothetical protein [Ensifer adhaerens]UCM19975.1 hypothetical protein LDL63_19565 [Ensifer adhaerens]